MSGHHYTVAVALGCLIALFGLHGRSEAQRAPQKFALLVAIDHYGAPHTPRVKGKQWRALGGAENDVRMLASELRKRGFRVKVLTNNDATKANIIASFERYLIDKVEPGRGDVALFHFSGHSQQIADDNGAPDEADHLDESLVPYDNKGVEDGSGNLRDDELGVLLDRLSQKTPNVVITLDSCHSGTGTRGVLNVRGGEPPPPGARAPGKTRSLSSADDSLLPNTRRGGKGYVVLSATQPEQLAKEIRVGDRAMGAFTWSLVRALRRANANTTYRQLLNEVAIEVADQVYAQSPQFEGDASKKIFSGQWSNETYFSVGKLTQEGLLPIEAGRLHGLTPGSVLGIYRTVGPMRRDQPLFKATIVSLDLGEAMARPLGAFDQRTLERGGRAIELEARQSPSKLTVWVPGQARFLRELLKQEPFYDVVTRGNVRWDIKVSIQRGWLSFQRLDGSTVGVPVGSGLPVADTLGVTSGRLSADSTPVAVRGRLSGRSELPDTIGQVVMNTLRLEARRRMITRLNNTDPRSNAEVALTVFPIEAVKGPPTRVTRIGGCAPGQRGCTPEHQGMRVKVGQLVQFQITNHGEKPLYVSLVELSPDGSVTVLYPSSRSKENLVQPGATLAIPNDLGHPIWQLGDPAGKAIYKAIATEHHVDLRALSMRARQARFKPRNALERLMGEALGGTRSVDDWKMTHDARWGTSSVIHNIVK